jgi:hypothetical protein
MIAFRRSRFAGAYLAPVAVMGRRHEAGDDVKEETKMISGL